MLSNNNIFTHLKNAMHLSLFENYKIRAGKRHTKKITSDSERSLGIQFSPVLSTVAPWCSHAVNVDRSINFLRKVAICNVISL